MMSLEGLSLQGVLGQGTFGEVREAVHRATGRKLAVKIIEKARLNRKRRDRIQQEVDHLTRLADHDGICRLYQAAQDDRCVYLLLEHMNGGDLFDCVQRRGGPLDERREVRPLFRQLCEAVRHCHARGVVHSDIKLENLMLTIPPSAMPHHRHHHHDAAGDDEEDDNGRCEMDDSRGEETDDEDEDEPTTTSMTTRRRDSTKRRPSQEQEAEEEGGGELLPAGARVKLIDFGLACRVERPGQLLATFSGTEQYAAPEMLEGRAYDGFKTDAYALGVVLYLLLTGAYPFSPDDVEAQFDEQTSPGFLASLPFPPHVSADARDLVWSLLRPDPRKRLSLDGALLHPFLHLVPEGAHAHTQATSRSTTTTTTADAESDTTGDSEREEEEREDDDDDDDVHREELQAAAVLACLDSDDMSLGY